MQKHNAVGLDIKMNRLINRFESKLATFLGLEENYNTHVDYIELHGNTVLVVTNEANKRHRIIKDWESFAKNDLKRVDEITQSKLGIALGKAIAPDLTVTIKPAITHFTTQDEKNVGQHSKR